MNQTKMCQLDLSGNIDHLKFKVKNDIYSKNKLLTNKARKTENYTKHIDHNLIRAIN